MSSKQPTVCTDGAGADGSTPGQKNTAAGQKNTAAGTKGGTTEKKSETSNQGGKLILPCEKKEQKVVPPDPKPCDLDTLQIKCSHCGPDKKREDFPEGKFWINTEKNDYITNYPDGRSLHPEVRLIRYQFWAVTANTRESSEDKITLKLTRAKCHHPGEHPSIFITPPPEMGGKPLSYKGKTELEFQVGYPKDWFKRNLEAAKQKSGLAAITGFFFPAPVAYRVTVLSCGQRPSGQKAFGGNGQWQQQILVYTDDVFKLSIEIPPSKKTESIRKGGSIGQRDYSSVERSQTTQRGELVVGHKETTYEMNGRTAFQRTDVVQDRLYGVKQTHTLLERPGGTAESNRIREINKTDSKYKSTAKSFTFTHNGADVANEIKLIAFLEKVTQIRKLILDFVDLLRKIGDGIPDVGWSFTWTLDLFSGGLELEWGWKEWGKDNTVYPYWKVGASFTIVSASLRASFGVSVLGSKAEVFGVVKIDIKLAGEFENSPESKVNPSITGTVSPEGELGLHIVAGELVQIEGKLVGGYEGKTTMEFRPSFKWEMTVRRAEIKAKAKAKFFWGCWLYQEEWTPVEKGPLMRFTFDS